MLLKEERASLGINTSTWLNYTLLCLHSKIKQEQRQVAVLANASTMLDVFLKTNAANLIKQGWWNRCTCSPSPCFGSPSVQVCACCLRSDRNLLHVSFRLAEQQKLHAWNVSYNVTSIHLQYRCNARSSIHIHWPLTNIHSQPGRLDNWDQFSLSSSLPHSRTEGSSLYTAFTFCGWIPADIKSTAPI